MAVKGVFYVFAPVSELVGENHHQDTKTPSGSGTSRKLLLGKSYLYRVFDPLGVLVSWS